MPKHHYLDCPVYSPRSPEAGAMVRLCPDCDMTQTVPRAIPIPPPTTIYTCYCFTVPLGHYAFHFESEFTPEQLMDNFQNARSRDSVIVHKNSDTMEYIGFPAREIIRYVFVAGYKPLDQV